MAYQVVVSLSHDCQLRKLYTELNINFRVYCNTHFDFYMFDRSLTNDQISIVTKSITDLEPLSSDNLLLDNYIIIPCKNTERSHLMHFHDVISEEFGIIFAYPEVRYKGEIYLYHSLDVNSHKNLLSKFESSHQYSIISIQEYPIEEYYNNYMFSLPELADKMTPRQQHILFTAYFKGYYRIPREITLQNIASEEKTSRYNIEKILRSGEAKIMRHIFPFIR